MRFVKILLIFFLISSVKLLTLTKSNLNDIKLIFNSVNNLNILITKSNNSVFNDLITVISNKTIIVYFQPYLEVDLICNKKVDWNTSTINGNIIYVNFPDFINSMDCLVNSMGTFVFIIDDKELDLKKNNFKEVIFLKLLSAWKILGANKIIIIFNEEILIFNPFLWNESTNEYGVMVNFNDLKDLPNFHDLNGYPLRIDIFESTYSVGGYYMNSKNLDYFQGTDIEILRSLMKSMNFTSKYKVQLDTSTILDPFS